MDTVFLRTELGGKKHIEKKKTVLSSGCNFSYEEGSNEVVRQTLQTAPMGGGLTLFFKHQDLKQKPALQLRTHYSSLTPSSRTFSIPPP